MRLKNRPLPVPTVDPFGDSAATGSIATHGRGPPPEP
jgi:hypothetical protein